VTSFGFFDATAEEVETLRDDPSAVEVALHPDPPNAFAAGLGPAAVFVLPAR
jgi:hypothetical protein